MDMTNRMPTIKSKYKLKDAEFVKACNFLEARKASILEERPTNDQLAQQIVDALHFDCTPSNVTRLLKAIGVITRRGWHGMPHANPLVHLYARVSAVEAEMRDLCEKLGHAPTHLIRGPETCSGKAN